jgi:hypothetical protein
MCEPNEPLIKIEHDSALAMLFLVVFLAVVLFIGEPDLHDALIEFLQKK